MPGSCWELRSRLAILVAGAIGLVWAIAQLRRDRLPLYFLIHFADVAGDPDVADAGP